MPRGDTTITLQNLLGAVGPKYVVVSRYSNTGMKSRMAKCSVCQNGHEVWSSYFLIPPHPSYSYSSVCSPGYWRTVRYWGYRLPSLDCTVDSREFLKSPAVKRRLQSKLRVWAQPSLWRLVCLCFERSLRIL